METEIWPNFLIGCARRQIPVFLANGRISDRSLRRYRTIARFIRPVLGNITEIGAQSTLDRERFLEIGADPSRVRVTGNLKFDHPAPDLACSRAWLDSIRVLLELDSHTPAVVAGSTMKGEEPLLLDAFQRVRRRVVAKSFF
jgi:3-deoxy-D-manno-octulosonic-acid transferase